MKKSKYKAQLSPTEVMIKKKYPDAMPVVPETFYCWAVDGKIKSEAMTLDGKHWRLQMGIDGHVRTGGQFKIHGGARGIEDRMLSAHPTAQLVKPGRNVKVWITSEGGWVACTWDTDKDHSILVLFDFPL